MGFSWDLDYKLSLICFGEVKKCGVQHSIQRELTLLEASAIETFGIGGMSLGTPFQFNSIVHSRHYHAASQKI